jgi:hypothetical protein
MNRSLLTLLIAALTAALVLGGWEAYWRAQGYQPMLADDRDLWSQFRHRVAGQNMERNLTVIGASRIQLAWSPAEFARLQPGWQSTSLAINGHYPGAVLFDLAADEHFTGRLLMAVDARGLSHWYQDMAEPYVRHYRRDYGPQRKLERRLLSRLQMRLVLAGADFSVVRRLAGAMDGHPPYRPYITFLPDRTIAADFDKADVEALRAGFAQGLAESYQTHPAPEPGQWLADLAPVLAAIETIQARGGQVVVLRMPTSDRHWELDEQNYPRAEYWDRFAEITTAHTVHFQDWPTLSELETPDTSHIDQTDRPRFTAAVVEILRELDVLPPSS